MLQNLRWVGRLEGVSFLLLLLIAMPVKYLLGRPEAVRVVGMLHGVLFIALVALLTYAARKWQWPKKQLWLGYASAFLPLGTFWFEKRFLPKEAA